MAVIRCRGVFAGPVTTHVKPGKFDLVTSKFKETVIPSLNEQPGFRHVISCFDAVRCECRPPSFFSRRECDCQD